MRAMACALFVVAFRAAVAATTNYYELDASAFGLAAAQQIQTATVNYDLLGAAVFRETNERRRQHGLQALKYDPGATAAAKIQSEIMRGRGAISHVNPEAPRYRTLDLRVKSVGLDYRLIAENVATSFALQYQSGRPFYTDWKNGQPIFSYERHGAPIPPHTYASFAKTLVDAWMNSKGHRENMLRKEAQYLGAYCAPPTSPTNMIPIFYCTQVFFTPAKPLPQPR